MNGRTVCLRVEGTREGIIYLYQPTPFIFMNIDKGKKETETKETLEA